MQDYYIVLCDQYFVIFNKSGAVSYSKHNFTILHLETSDYTMQALKLQCNQYNLYLLVQDKLIYTLLLSFNNH